MKKHCDTRTNILSGGAAVVYADVADVAFDNTPTNTNVNLEEILSPGSVVVNFARNTVTEGERR